MQAPGRTLGAGPDSPRSPRLAVAPVGLWLFGLACELAYRATQRHIWLQVGFYALGAGLAAALAVGLISLKRIVAISDPRGRRAALASFPVGLVAAVLVGAAFWLRQQVAAADPRPPALMLAALTLVAALAFRGRRRRSPRP